MRQLGLMTMATLYGLHGAQLPMRATLVTARARMTPFGIWHNLPHFELSTNFCSACQRGSAVRGLQRHDSKFKLTPHPRQRPLQSSRHNSFAGMANNKRSRTSTVMSISRAFGSRARISSSLLCTNSSSFENIKRPVSSKAASNCSKQRSHSKRPTVCTWLRR